MGPNQFARKYHSAPDAATLLRYKATKSKRSGRVSGVLLLNISRFFDHLNPDILINTLCDMGVDPQTCAWIRSFMTDRSLSLSFNNYSTDRFVPTSGTPQGSPLSPIASALYTAPLLKEALTWETEDLTLYVDDGAIFASGETYNAVTSLLTSAATQVFSWLRDHGLTADEDKTEILFFSTRGHSIHHGISPTSVTFPAPFSHISITPTQTLRYLGVFFNTKLTWHYHAKTLPHAHEVFSMASVS